MAQADACTKVRGIATKNFVEIINDQLSILNSDERVYPILFNNVGHIIFLTDKQYHFVSLYVDKTERPMEINLWWQTFKNERTTKGLPQGWRT